MAVTERTGRWLGADGDALASRTVRTSLGLVAVALVCLIPADLEISAVSPWAELGRFLGGILQPDFATLDTAGTALLRTVAFAFCGVALGAAAGMGLALVFQYRAVRTGCAFVRAIHELFWALIFLQIFGLHPLTGVLAIAIPYAGVFARVYSEILEEADPTPTRALPPGTGLVAAFWYARVPDVWPHLMSYTSYRLECGLRSSAVLGFVGMPTLGFYLESAYGEGHYGEVGMLLLVFFALIASLRLWVRPRLVPLYLLAAPWFLGTGLPIMWGNMGRFFTEDIVPAPLRAGEGLPGLFPWLGDLLMNQALPGIAATLVLTQIALVATGLLALASFPMISRQFTGRLGGGFGHAVLIVARSTPEYLLAYILLQLWGPSMLPAAVALALHNGAIIGHLIGRQSNELVLRPDAPRGLNRYAFEVVPRLYGSFLAFLFYRWEIIMRETAILGILGITTLGFYVDSAIQELRFDRALVLILITAALNIAVDALARHLRRRLHLRTTPTCEA
ncbi:PhnE/PtxC family ABC transporter permease [Spiribacter halobius]|uniref:ABC transporter permease n=1 Tax=Sediminicurvatus halobius TaxID=2182432 RepID=A0A2U2N6P0_9GAMM|nr:ABC transporter permease [Spiribacter halobius]PWG64836.1 ABC transporter permease [Spiribacter halobius]UEX78309.1 ABC transporter permease [Spiribacter halobius]